MKIVFLTNCLQQEKDGVGDYTRLLGQECEKQGHVCRLIALNDHFVEFEKHEIQAGMEALRLGANTSLRNRIRRAQPFFSDFDPDWCSLQFVCYGFHPRGINIRLAKSLRKLIRAVPLQIMFHELWIGSEIGAPLKRRFIGGIQKHFVLDLISRLRPRVIQTSNPAYVHLLGQNRVAARELPLFGNLPVQSESGDGWIYPELQSHGTEISESSRNDFWLFGIFGSFHPIWPAEPLFTYLQEAARLNRKKIVLLAIGQLGSGMEHWKSLVRKYSDRIRFCYLGEQPSQRISEFFNSIDFGIATTPYVLIGKSGSVAAMVEHGLPVIVNRDELQFSEYSPQKPVSPLIIKMDEEISGKFATVRRGISLSRQSSVALRFLNALNDL